MKFRAATFKSALKKTTNFSIYFDDVEKVLVIRDRAAGEVSLTLANARWVSETLRLFIRDMEIENEGAVR